MKTEGRPTTPEAVNMNERQTVSGSKGLNQAEKLIFEVGTPRRTGVDLPEPKGTKSRLGTHARKGEIGLPGLSEPETMRHYVRLCRALPMCIPCNPSKRRKARWKSCMCSRIG